MFLALTDTCTSLKSIFDIINNVIKVIGIVVPILIILFGTFDLLKALVAQKDDDMKKAWVTVLKRALYGVVIFLLATLVMFALNGVGNAKVDNCLTTAKES